VSTPSSTAPLGPPLIGALLRMPGDIVRARMLAALHERGFTDLVPAHLVLLRWPGPQGRRPSEIAAGSDMTKQAANYLLGQLEALGYLERRPDPDDNRSRRVHLTPRGLEAAETMRHAVSELEAEWTTLLGADDFEALRSLLTRLNDELAGGQS
jgi:DNA-binding MarR family transcriptional regulator